MRGEAGRSDSLIVVIHFMRRLRTSGEGVCGGVVEEAPHLSVRDDVYMADPRQVLLDRPQRVHELVVVAEAVALRAVSDDLNRTAA